MWEDKPNQEDKGIWKERVNTDTGESSIAYHTPKLVKTWCKNPDHNFELIDSPKRLVRCTECGYEANFVLGLQMLEGGKIVDKV